MIAKEKEGLGVFPINEIDEANFDKVESVLMKENFLSDLPKAFSLFLNLRKVDFS